MRKNFRKYLRGARRVLQPRESLRLIVTGRWGYLRYLIGSRARGVDLETVLLEDLQLSPERSAPYRDSGGPDLERVFKRIAIPEGSSALDYGSGKGGAVFTLSKFPFAQVVGVDISAELIQIARANAARLGLKNIVFHCTDAGAFNDLDAITHIYMYNPFPQPVVEQVMQNLVVSLQRRPRPLTLVYRNPVCHDAVIKSGIFRMTAEINLRRKSHSFYVYSQP